MGRIVSFGAPLLTPLVLVACAGAGDDATGGDSATSTGGAAAGDVRLSTRTDYLPLGGDMMSASEDPTVDGTEITVEVDGEVIAGVYDGKAWVVFADVPEETFRIHWARPPAPSLPAGTPGSHGFVETAKRDLFVGEIASGRAGRTIAEDDATALRITASGMSPLGLDDTFEIYSYNADVGGRLSFDPFAGGGQPTLGEGTIGGWTVPWKVRSATGDAFLVDPSLGDDLWLSHHIASPLPNPVDVAWSSSFRTGLLEVAPLSLSPMVDGVTTDANGEFMAPTPQVVAVDARPGAFAQELLLHIPSPEYVSFEVDVILEPGIDAPNTGWTPTLASAIAWELGGAPADQVVELHYANPYPVGVEVVFLRCTLRQTVTHPIAGTEETLQAASSRHVPVAELNAGLPTIGPVGDLRINDETLAINDVRAGVGTAPTISFTPPSLGAPDNYYVQVWTIDDVVDGEGTVLLDKRSVLGISSESATITLPDGILEPGSYYYAIVGASVGVELGAARPYTHHLGYAYASTGLFTP